MSGFVYYHYWFNGKRLLERPFDEVLASGSPDFPFALCWANEEWTRNWDASTGQVLMPQEFSDADDLAHIRWLATAFADDRYINIDGRPLMLVYRPQQLPDPKRTFDIWREEAQALGFPDLYLCWVESHGPPPGGPAGLRPRCQRRASCPSPASGCLEPLEGTRGHRILDYRSAYLAELGKRRRPLQAVPLGHGGVGQHGPAARSGPPSSRGPRPEAYERWLRLAVDSVSEVHAGGELPVHRGLERVGRGQPPRARPALRPGLPRGHQGRAADARGPADVLRPGELRRTETNREVAPEEAYDYVYPFEHESAVGHAAGLVRHLVRRARAPRWWTWGRGPRWSATHCARPVSPTTGSSCIRWRWS